MKEFIKKQISKIKEKTKLKNRTIRDQALLITSLKNKIEMLEGNNKDIMDQMHKYKEKSKNLNLCVADAQIKYSKLKIEKEKADKDIASLTKKVEKLQPKKESKTTKTTKTKKKE